MTELERIDQAIEYFRRYDDMEAAIVQNRENQDYIKTYIHDESYVSKNFDIGKKRLHGIGISAGVAAVMFLLLLAVSQSVVAAAVLGGFVLICGSVFAVALQHYRFTEAKKYQQEVNNGIAEQIEILKAREPQLIQTKDNYLEGLKKRVTFISVEDRKYVGELRRMIESGEAQTVEEAAGALEQKLLMQQFTNIMEQNEIPIKTYTEEENKERFGDPLELIGKKRRSFFKKKKK